MSGTRTLQAVLLGLFAVLAACALMLIGFSGSASASCSHRGAVAATTTPGLQSGAQISAYASIERDARSVVSNEAAPGDTNIAPVTASTTVQSSIGVLPWILGVLAVAVAAGSVRAYVRSPQRQASRTERASR